MRRVVILAVYCCVICLKAESGLLAQSSYSFHCDDYGFKYNFTPSEVKTGHFLLATRAERKEAARSLLLAAEKLFAALPNLSPEERKWLESEEAVGGRRMVAAMTSVAYHKRQAKLEIQYILACLELILSESPPLRREIGSWASLTTYYNDKNLAVAITELARAQVIDTQFIPKVEPEESLAGICRFTAQHIMNKVVIPYLFEAVDK